MYAWLRACHSLSWQQPQIFFNKLVPYNLSLFCRWTGTRAIVSRITASAARGISPASRATSERGCSASACTTPLRLRSRASPTGEWRGGGFQVCGRIFFFFFAFFWSGAFVLLWSFGFSGVRRSKAYSVRFVVFLVMFIPGTKVIALYDDQSTTRQAMFHTLHRWSVWFVPTTDHDLPGRDVWSTAYVTRCKCYDLHDLRHVSWVGCVLYRSSTTSHVRRVRIWMIYLT